MAGFFHGWAAEEGNNLIDNIKGVFKGYHAKVISYDNAKNGADRQITYANGMQILIQTKYYQSAAAAIDACFDRTTGQFRYVTAKGLMQIEVPSDQYKAAISAMERHISNGDLEQYGYAKTDKSRATELVRKGNLTYRQALHIAKAGNVQSIVYDAVRGTITGTTAFGICGAVTYAINRWNGQPRDVAWKEALMQGLSAGGTTFIISVFSAQLAKSGLNTAMVPASKVIAHKLGPKVSAVIANAFRSGGSPIYGAAAMQHAAKLLRGNAITMTVTFVVLTAKDAANIIRGKISWKQLAKNASVTAVSIAGGAAGTYGGAALGSLILPGAGSIVGGFIGGAVGSFGASIGAKALADMIAEDDAVEMVGIIEELFPKIAEEYYLNEAELSEIMPNLEGLINARTMTAMFQSENRELFARQLIESAIDPVVAKRAYIELPSEDEYADYLAEVLNEIYEELSTEMVSE